MLQLQIQCQVDILSWLGLGHFEGANTAPQVIDLFLQMPGQAVEQALIEFFYPLFAYVLGGGIVLPTAGAFQCVSVLGVDFADIAQHMG